MRRPNTPVKRQKMKTLRKHFSKFLGVVTALLMIYIGLFDPPEKIRIPTIIAWLPKLVGWDSFFIIMGLVAGLIVWWLFKPENEPAPELQTHD
jgi:hypothetical protein